MRPTVSWTPTVSAPRTTDLAEVVRVVGGRGVVVLSGAGLSTESGIPDYRGETGRRRRTRPMTYQTFVGSAAARRRYWARGHLGWRHIDRALPNTGHRAVAALQARGLVSGIITQNVDGLHQAAGAQRVVELHGSLHRVRCLDCGERTARRELERRLREANPGWDARAEEVNPDGDVVLAEEWIDSFRVVDCRSCGGVLKPDVVFFGENVPRPRVQHCFDLTEEAGALLVLGSSLTVASGHRFVRRAAERAVPVAIVNRGATRGDPQALVRLDASLGPTLAVLLAALDVVPSCPASAGAQVRASP